MTPCRTSQLSWDNVNSLLVLCREITAQLGFSPSKVRKDATGTLEAPIGKLSALQDVLARLQSAIGRYIHSAATLPVGTEDDVQGILDGSRDSLKQLQAMLRKNASEEGGIFSKMRKASISAGAAKDVEDVCRALDIQKTALKLCLVLITTRGLGQFQADDLDDPPGYTSTFDVSGPPGVANEKDDDKAELPSYGDFRAQSSSTYPLQLRKAKVGDVKDVKAPLPIFSEPMHANNATARDAEFIYAVKNSKNGIPNLESYLPKIDDLNARHSDQGTALQAAVSDNLTGKVQWLLEKGAHPDIEGGAAGTAVKRAVAKGNRAIIHLLFDFGANPNIEEGSDKGGSALEIAQPAIFDLLLLRGASPDTPRVMYTAIRNHKLWMVEKLLAAEAEIEMRWHMYPYSPLNEAVHCGDQGILNLLLVQGADSNAAATGPGPHPSTFTPLLSAIYSNRFEQLRILLKHGADPYTGGFFQTAAGLGHTKTIECLVEEIGMDINNLDDLCKRTALIEATEYGRDETVRYLLSRKADIPIRAATGRTALQDGVKRIHSGCVRLLLKAGANAKDEGMLQDAVATGSLTNIKLLVGAGADVNAKSRKTGTPLEEAAKIGRTDMIEYLVSHGANVNGGKESEKPPLWHATEHQHNSSVKMLLGFGASTTCEDFLHCAARGGSIAVLQEFLASGVDINLRDSKGRTAFEEAREKGFQDVVNFLRIHGAVVDKTSLDENLAWRKE